ncbi:MAG: hypothetical protein GWP15_03090 [Nitrospirae bacterium]|nr:hypothetical protein [Nitrospirota bacterium]
MYTNTQKIIKNIAKDIELPYDLFLQESSRLFLETKIKKIRIGILEIAGKYGVSTISEFENLYRQGKIEESQTLDDYKRLDRLEYEKEKIEKLLQELKF